MRSPSWIGAASRLCLAGWLGASATHPLRAQEKGVLLMELAVPHWASRMMATYGDPLVSGPKTGGLAAVRVRLSRTCGQKAQPISDWVEGNLIEKTNY